MSPQFWLAEVDQYGNAKLVDGAHQDAAGANKANTLFRRLGLANGKKLMVAEVRLSEPTSEHEPVDESALGMLAKAGLRPKADDKTAKEMGT